MYRVMCSLLESYFPDVLIYIFIPFHVPHPFGGVAGCLDVHLFFARMPSSMGAVFQIKLPSSSSFLAKLSVRLLIISMNVDLKYACV